MNNGVPPGVSARSRLAAEAYREIRSAVSDGRLTAGAGIVEAEVAAMLGISRTPVRQALRRLEMEGFLERDERGRLFVHELSDEEVSQIFAVRRLLEPHGARMATNRISSDELERLDALLSVEIEASRVADATLLTESGEQMQDLLMEACRNRTLARIVRDLSDRVEGSTVFRSVRLEHRQRMLKDQTRLVRLVRDGDDRGAEHAVEDQLDFLTEALLGRMARTARP